MSHPGYDNTNSNPPEEPAPPPAYPATSEGGNTPSPTFEPTPAYTPARAYEPTPVSPAHAQPEPPAYPPVRAPEPASWAPVPPPAQPEPAWSPAPPAEPATWSPAPPAQPEPAAWAQVPPQSAPPQSVTPQSAPPQFAPAAEAAPQFGPVPGAYGQPQPQPQYGQTGGFQTGPVPPTYDPAAMQYSAPPVSGPYGYGMPMMSAIPAPPQKRGRAGTVILAVLTALFLVVAGIMGTLFIIKNKEADKLTAQVSQLNTDLSTAQSKAATLQKDLDAAKRDLADSKGETAEVTTQKKAIADCINALYDYFDAADKDNSTTTPAVKAKEADANAKCDIAEKYL